MTTIRIFTDITDKTLVELAKYLDSIEDGSEVTLQICSAGGFVFCAFGIIDYLKARHFKTTAEVLGMAASAAALIAISCDRVRMAEYASLMIHGAYGDGIDSSDPGIVRANELALEIIRKRDSKFTAQQLETDTWIGGAIGRKNGPCRRYFDKRARYRRHCADIILRNFITGRLKLWTMRKRFVLRLLRNSPKKVRLRQKNCLRMM